MKKYKYVTIQEVGEFKNKPIYSIFNNRDNTNLATIEWYPIWKKYVVDFDSDCVFSSSCLRDIVDFMENEVKE